MPAQKISKFFNNKGFTLIELLVAIAIIGILSGILISSVGAVQKRARDTQRQSDLRNIQAALQQYYADQNYFPDTLNMSGSGNISFGSKVYLNNIPLDPAQTQYFYQAQNLSGGTTCDNTSILSKCHRYAICTRMELSTTGSTCPASSTLYNFQLTPP